MKTVGFWEEIGPVYDIVGVCALLREEQSLVDRLVGEHQLLALPTESGRFIYPAFQFTSSGGVLKGLGDVLHTLVGTGLSSWTIASWFVSPEEDLGGQTPLAVLTHGEGADVLALAERWATETA